MTVRPMQKGDAAHVVLRPYSRFSRDALDDHAQSYPGLIWLTEYQEYIIGGHWKSRTEVGEILELGQTARSFMGLLPPALNDHQWPSRRQELISALVESFRLQGSKLVLLSDREARERLSAYVSFGFQPVEQLVHMYRDGVQAPPPSRRLELRAATHHDLAALMDIERRIFPWLWWYGEDEWRLILMMGSVETYLAYAGGDIIGYETHTVFETRGHVDRLGIHPRYQGNYYGQDLLLHSLRRIAAQGGQDAALSTQLHNTPAQRLYSKHGFRRSGAPMIFYGFALDGSHSLAKMVATPEAQPPQ